MHVIPAMHDTCEVTTWDFDTASADARKHTCGKHSAAREFMPPRTDAADN
jgi:hypothetical protein